MVSSPRKQIENVKVEPGISGTHSIISVSIISIINDLTTQKTDKKCIRRTWDLWDPLNNLCIHTWKTDEEYKRCTYLGSLGHALRSTPWTWSASSSCESSLVVHLILQMWSPGWSLRQYWYKIVIFWWGWLVDGLVVYLSRKLAGKPLLLLCSPSLQPGVVHPAWGWNIQLQYFHIFFRHLSTQPEVGIFN